MSLLIATDLHCTRCGALPDEPCRTETGKSVPPHPERRAAEQAAAEGQTVREPAEALREVSTSELLTAIEVLTHRIHAAADHRGAARLRNDRDTLDHWHREVTDLRAQRRLARAEILRRTGDA